MMNRVKSAGRNVLKYLKNYDFLEAMLLNLLIIFGLIFSTYGYKFAVFIFAIVFFHRLFTFRLLNSLFTFKLFLKSEDDKLYIAFGVINIFMLFAMLMLNYDFFSAYLMLVFFRIILSFENTYVQNKILRDAVEELYNFGESFEISPLADKNTRRNLTMLSSIKKEIEDSVNRSMKTERLKTELITNISHDLKTPLTSIINYADILSKKSEMDLEAREYIAVLGRNSERLRSLIIDLIYASKTGSGAIKVEKVFLDFNELVSQIYGDFDELLSKKNLEFVYDYDEEINLYTDPGIVSRIVQNLISNAYKYSKPGTKILCHTKVFEDFVYFEMKNESLNPIETDGDSLIDELVKSEKSRTTEGSGLGLYITRNLSEILNGEFHIEIIENFFVAKLILPREN